MSAFEKAIWIVKLPFRLAWWALLLVNFLVVAPLVILAGAFVVYWAVLTFSYLLLPEAWTLAMWSWASGMYGEYMWFKVATIVAFTVLLLPLFRLGPIETQEERERESERLRELGNQHLAAQEWETRWRATNG